MLVLVVLVGLISAYLVARGLSNTAASLSLERSKRTVAALQEAKTALIAYAANESLTRGGTPVLPQPGVLPCPDTDNDGFAESTCDTVLLRVGRLPWRTLRIADLRDDSGEILWYAVSANFRKRPTRLVINSSTAGTLAVSGAAPATGAVALVIAPGAALQNQNRDPSNASAFNSAANYLEGANTNTTDDASQTRTFETRVPPNDRDSAGGLIFNDQLAVIGHSDLFEAVEPVVAAMIERDIKPYLVTYFTEWSGAFPYPAKFADPSPGTNTQVSPAVASTRLQSQYLGDPTVASEGGGNGRGLLPITASVTYPWTAGSGTVVLTGGLAGSISGVTCAAISSPFNGWQCSFTLNSLDSWGTCVFNRYCMQDPSFTVTGQIGANAGISFAKLPGTSEVTVTSAGGLTRTMSAKAIGGTLSAAGVGTVRFSGAHSPYSRYNASPFTRTMVVRIPDVLVSSLTSSSDANAGWYIANEWYRLTYYVVSPGHLPGGGASCIALPGTPSCLTVNNMPSLYSSPSTNKRAALVIAGRSVNGSSRPSTAVADYLEGENATPADYILQHRIVPASSINDRVVVVSP